MNLPASCRVLFDELTHALPMSQFWEYDCGTKGRLKSIANQAFQALQRPLDFPPVGAAIVAGDRVALAVDPNVPQLVDVIGGVLEAFAATEAGPIDIVVWDEADDATMDELQKAFGTTAAIHRHHSDDRSSLRYMAADNAAEAIYLNRFLVDADFVLPIVATRAMDRTCRHDLTGVYPSLADSATRLRHQIQMSGPETKDDESNEAQIPWLLGVHLIMTVTANASGSPGEVIAGTPEAIGKQVTPIRRSPDNFPPPAPLVIASLDGDAQQQSWENASRAAVAASRYVQPGGTIVLWTEISQAPNGNLTMLDEFDHLAAQADAGDIKIDEDGHFPEWSGHDAIAAALARIAGDYRLIVHSRLPRETIEALGVGVIETVSELGHLCSSFDSCGVLRAAQFAGSTVDAPYRIGVENR